MSVILQAASSTQMSITNDQKVEITNYINMYRRAHQAPDLVWDNSMAEFSQNWSNYLSMNSLFQHSGSQLYGENLAYFHGYGCDIVTLLKSSVDLWYQEIASYDFTKPGFNEATGHFTCLVWKNSTKFGMGFSCSDDNTAVVSFNTSPPGNVIGEFDKNVLPKIDTVPIPSPTPLPPPSVPTTPPVAPSPPFQPEPPSSVKIMEVISGLYKILQEIKRPSPNKILITNYLKHLIKELVKL